MSVQVTYGQKTLKFEPTEKVSKLADKLAIKALASTLWQVNGNTIEKQITMTATLQSLGVKEQDMILILSPVAPSEKKMEPIQPPAPDQQQAQQISSKMNSNIIPQFEQKKIIVPQRPVKSNKPNKQLPQMTQANIYGYDVKILDQGCAIEISKPNNEFKATLLIDNTTQEESFKVKFQPNEVHNEPEYTLRIGTRELGGTKISFLRDGKGFGVLWHNGLQSKFQFWFDE